MGAEAGEGPGGGSRTSPDDPVEALREKVARFPRKPGVYLWKDAAGKTLYVGKSIDLRARVGSYFGANPTTPDKAAALLARAVDIDFFVTDSEADALILEYRLIHQEKPRFNVVFRDDKSYPMIKITNEAYPRILVTRRKHKDGATYLGPYPSAGAVRRTLKLLTGLFPIRDCGFSSEQLPRAKLCLSYHIKRCAGPCEGLVDPGEYRALAAEAGRFLTGDTAPVLEALKARMEAAAAALDFEGAALYRDRYQGLSRLTEPRRVESMGTPFDEDVIAAARRDGVVAFQVIHYRKGRMEGQRRVTMRRAEPLEALMAEWVATHYLGSEAPVPGALVLTHEPAGRAELEAALLKVAGRRVELAVPERGRRHELSQMALRNLQSYFESREAGGAGAAAVARLAAVLGLEEPPARIECFDISNLGAVEKVASMVVALDGEMARGEYRRFVIKTVEGQDDFASMAEVVRRRYSRVVGEGRELPELVVVDGGPGQVDAAGRVLRGELGLEGLPLVGLAKREERIHRPGDLEGLALAPDDPARLLLQKIRDEAHRFALTHHRKRREKRSLASELDGIPGVGPASRRALLGHFREVASIRKAALEDLLAVDGLTRKAAEAVFRYYRSQPSGTVGSDPGPGPATRAR